jgi:RNA polymerase sigma-54 factor
MALEIRQSLGLQQQLIMTPQLQQAIKLLQLSRLELLETISQEMETNPVLEEQTGGESDEDTSVEDSGAEGEDLPEVTVEERAREDVDWESYISEYNTGWAETPYDSDEPPPFENITATKTNLYDHLMWQLHMSAADEDLRYIGEHIICNLNDDGYLEDPLEEISLATGQPEDKVAAALEMVQNFDPVGVAARDARESLLIQVRFQNLGGTIVEKIIMDHLRDLEAKKYEQIAKKLSVSLQDILSAVSIITRLDPKPGRVYSDEETIYITPDIYVFRVGDDYVIQQNTDGLPRLRINSYYKDILRRRDAVSESAKAYIQEKLKSAAWLIKSIQQRQRTIYRVTESIVKFQRGFFDHGITKLKPLVLRDVAEDIQMHESTVSRVTTNKYVYTPQGIFELKFFFNSSISSGNGDAVASESVKERIRNMVKSENPGKPFSDQEIADFLKKQGINVARRTVAKYRESMGILPSRKRRNPYQSQSSAPK